MATTRFVPTQKPAGSPRPKGRENAKETLCRNVLIYGHCRYEDQGCAFNHEPNKVHGSPDISKKTLTVDSPSFTPAALANNLASTSITSRAASAAPFTPRSIASGTATPNIQSEEVTASFNPSQIREFTPSNYETINGNTVEHHNPYDPFSMATSTQAATAQYNPYLEDGSNLAAASAAYYPQQAAFATTAQPLQYHLYAPAGLRREDLAPHQRTAHDFFMPEKLREEMQRKSEATLQVMPNSQLPVLDHYHSLVALDISHHKNLAIFSYPSWVYKAQSSKDGRYYCLRRFEGYRLTNEKAIQSVKNWKRVDNGGIATIIDAFTTRAFGDSSIVFVFDYYPNSKTLVEHHFAAPANRYGSRTNNSIPVQIIWGYVVQIASAIKSVHSSGLAIRCMDPSKIILTSKNRVRFSACSILDVILYEGQRATSDLQQDDLGNFGRLLMILCSNNLNPPWSVIDQIGLRYTPEVKEAITWLITPSQNGTTKTIDDFIVRISPHLITSFDSALHAEDTLSCTLMGELENGRIARLMMKLGAINERPEFEGDRNWGETGDRYMLKLMRDYIFHQVDANGHPVTDMGHMLRCLNKLDVGVDESIRLTSRDEQSTFVVTWKELKKHTSSAFGDLSKPQKQLQGVQGGAGRGYQ